MSTQLIQRSTQLMPLPAPRVTVRPGTLADVPFLDALQKLHTKQVGWMPTAQFEGKIALGHVIIAEDDAKQPVGYCIGNDRYFKRDDVGIIYQVNVVPGRQRAFVGATLLKAMFDRAAYGCRLFCCWCAQDIAANRFWEAMGFVPLAFRTGSARKSRVHIFWQKRIRSGDETTPWWFPSQTGGGSIREDRIVLPIPPGTHWSDAKPLVLPGGDNDVKALPKARVKATAAKVAQAPEGVAPGGLWMPPAVMTAIAVKERPARPPKVAKKNDPRLVAAARELRDRWLEQVNATPLIGQGKYDVSRALEARQSTTTGAAVINAVPSLPAPIAA